MKERDVQWFRPLWRRVLVTAICVLWAALELVRHTNQMWMLITVGLSAYAIWTFLLTFPKPVPAVSSKGDGNVPPQA